MVGTKWLLDCLAKSGSRANFNIYLILLIFPFDLYALRWVFLTRSDSLQWIQPMDSEKQWKSTWFVEEIPSAAYNNDNKLSEKKETENMNKRRILSAS